ncbi:hypothetical protein [Haloterrigena salifodinae]|uniref:hypothetical protein n=1 Tax=Haloterrigena salifodinae TaxID=2675099 RepID=UPI000F885E9D|nr:hypothetical protein [Haloterrigena salifodinae]
MERSQHAITHPTGKQFSLVTNAALLKFLLRYRSIEPDALEAAIHWTGARTISVESLRDAGTGGPDGTVRVSVENSGAGVRIEPARGS